MRIKYNSISTARIAGYTTLLNHHLHFDQSFYNYGIR